MVTLWTAPRMQLYSVRIGNTTSNVMAPVALATVVTAPPALLLLYMGLPLPTPPVLSSQSSVSSLLLLHSKATKSMVVMLKMLLLTHPLQQLQTPAFVAIDDAQAN